MAVLASNDLVVAYSILMNWWFKTCDLRQEEELAQATLLSSASFLHSIHMILKPFCDQTTELPSGGGGLPCRCTTRPDCSNSMSGSPGSLCKACARKLLFWKRIFCIHIFHHIFTVLSLCACVSTELSGACLGSGEPLMGIRPTSQSDKSSYTALAMEAYVSQLSLHSKFVTACCAANQSGICGLFAKDP